MKRDSLAAWFVPALLATGLLASCGGGGASPQAAVPEDMRAVMQQPRYAGATWAMRVVDADSGDVLIDTQPGQLLYIGSVRKLFTMGELLDQVGPEHRNDTPVYAQGTVAGGVLTGNLILRASGDLTMGGRTNPDGSIAVTDEDHNEADSLGNAVLSKPDPLAGYRALAAQVAAAGIQRVAGDVVIDARLFQPFPFRGEFNLLPIFVNDDLVDLTINPGQPGQPAELSVRPQSAALAVDSALVTGAAGSALNFTLEPKLSTCIGTAGCTTRVAGSIPVDYQPPFTLHFPLVQAIRITRPDNYARTVFIEALQAAGVAVDAPPVAENPVQLLPPPGVYPDATQVAELTGLPLADYTRFVLKISYNIGADTSLLLWGKTQGVDNMDAALAAEKTNLARNYGIASGDYQFFDGSGGGEAKAYTHVVTAFLARMRAQSPHYATFFDALPALGTDGSLAFVTDYTRDATLAGATGQVRAKTGTYAASDTSGALVLKGQAFGGYVHARSGRDLIYTVVVNGVPVTDVDAIAQVFQDEGTISAMLWRDY